MALEKEKNLTEKLFPSKTPTENRYILKNCFKRIIYQKFFDGKKFNCSSFINYITENTFNSLSQSGLIEVKKNILAKKFVELFEKYLKK